MRLEFSDAAIADLERLRSFLSSAESGATERAVADIVTAAGSLLQFPYRAPRLARRSARRLIVPFGRGAYVIDYRVDRARDAVVVLRIRHSRETR